MERVLPRPLDWRIFTALGVYLGLTVFMTGRTLLGNLPAPPDWEIWAEIPQRLADGTLYDGRFRWSPLMAYVWLVILPLGFWGFALLHIAVLPLIGWKHALLAVTFWGFWTDLAAGNAFIFVVVAGVLARHGNRSAEWTYLALTILIPRPIQLPLALWLLWKRPRTRLPFALMLLSHAALVAWTGYGADWLAQLTATPEHELGYTFPLNSSPSVVIGSWWLLVGVPLAAWLFTKGWVGWAGVAMSPYLLPYYWLMLLLDIRPERHAEPLRLHR